MRAQRSNPGANKSLDCFGARAPRNDVAKTYVRLPAAHRARVLQTETLRNREGAGKTGRWPRPWPACNKESRRQSPQVWPKLPAFPARWFDGLYVLSPGTGFLAPVVKRNAQASSPNLAPAPGRQDHTTSPSTPIALVERSRHVHRSPLHVRDDAYAPVVGAERQELNHRFRKSERYLFLSEELDKTR